jgi:hypothetical protein
MVNRWALGLATCLFAASVAAQDRLQIEAPKFWEGGWTQASDQVGQGWRLTVYRPAKASPKDPPKDLITVTTTWGGPQKDGVARAIRAWGIKVQGTCPGMTAVPPKPSSQNGFTVGYGQFYCPKRSDREEGSADFVKAIVSDTTAYLIAASHITPPFTSNVPGHIQYENSADTDALVEWLKNISEYLLLVRGCTGASPLELKCSPQ